MNKGAEHITEQIKQVFGDVLKHGFLGNLPLAGTIRRRFLPSEEDRMAKQMSRFYAPITVFNNLSETQKRLYVRNLPVVDARERQWRVDYAQKVKPEGWETTDPLNHDPNNYRYIVHDVYYDNDFVSTLKGGSPRVFYTNIAPTRKYSVTVDEFLSRMHISCSMIDEIHRGTYTDLNVGPDTYHGFILEVPEENIVEVWPHDMGKGQFSENDEIKPLNPFAIDLFHNTPSAQEFMRMSREHYYNEVVVNGVGPSGKRIKIAGIYLLTHPILGIPLYEVEIARAKRIIGKYKDAEGWQEEVEQLEPKYRQALDLAYLLRIPIVHIPQMITIEELKRELTIPFKNREV